MNLFDDIDFQLLRSKYGSSNARLFINGHCHNFFMTHMFNDPLQAICEATVLLAKEVNEVYFSWYDEPGQYDWKFTKAESKQYLLDVSIYKYSDMMGYYHQQASSNKVIEEINFKVNRDFWIALVTLEIAKIAKLLTYDCYKVERDAHTFPWQELKQLKQNY